MAYRRRRSSRVWHWCRNCSHWPSANYEAGHSDPEKGRRCRECSAKEERGACEETPRGQHIE